MLKTTPPATASRKRYHAKELPLRSPRGVEKLQTRPHRVGRAQQDIRRLQVLRRAFRDAVATQERDHAVDLAPEYRDRPSRPLFPAGGTAGERGAAAHD